MSISHIGFHLPGPLRRSLRSYIAGLTGEAAAPVRGRGEKTEGEFGIGEDGGWHLSGDTHPDRHGYFLAAYLGKGEPSQRLFRGKLRHNEKKPVRGRSFGGDQADGRYDDAQVLVIGTEHRKKRFGISKWLKGVMRAQGERP